MADQIVSPNPWRRTVRRRIVVVAAVFAVWAAAIEARLVQLQVFDRADLEERAESQRTSTVEVPATRGEILDREGRVLAFSVEQNAIVAVPGKIKDAVATVRAICDALGDCSADERADIVERLRAEIRLPNGRKRLKHFAYIRRANRVTPEGVARVVALGLPGIGLMKEARRWYPKQELAAHLLGYVGIDSKGLNGVEAAYNGTISGQKGQVLIQTDARRQPFASISRPPTPGTTLQLTIDEYLQHVAEAELQSAVEENRAAGGSVVVMDPHTGEILALANSPTFNPNEYQAAGEDERRNRAVQDVYEPGSTFKMVTASAAIEEHVWSPDEMIDTGNGAWSLGSRVVHDTSAHGVLSFVDVIVKSSNIGAIKIGLRVGAERMGRYVRRFGFGTRLSPDFEGENAGLLWDPSGWNDSILASVSMGYQIGVTPLQMATAASAVANGGTLVQPRIVKAKVMADGRRAEVHPKALRQVIQKSTADELTTIMEQVVERGTATAAKIPGYTIAGKTGTANKLEGGRYSKSDYNASFVGFIPSRDPVLTIIVVIDSPHAKGYYGGTVAAPAWKRIAEKAMQHLGVPPNVNPAPPLLVAPKLAASPLQAAAPSAARQVGLVPALSSPAAGAHVVPDVLGLNAREAIRALVRVGMTARVSGDGVVVQQEPRPGSTVTAGAGCALVLGRVGSSVPPVPDQHQ